MKNFESGQFAKGFGATTNRLSNDEFHALESILGKMGVIPLLQGPETLYMGAGGCVGTEVQLAAHELNASMLSLRNLHRVTEIKSCPEPQKR